jgi:hypothetical protein
MTGGHLDDQAHTLARAARTMSGMSIVGDIVDEPEVHAVQPK